MSFLFIIQDAKAKLQQCELTFEEKPDFTLLTRSIDKKHIRTGIRNSPYLSKEEKEKLDLALDTNVPLWFKRDDIQQYCGIYFQTIEAPKNCKRFVSKTPAEARFFQDSDHEYDLLEEDILTQLWKMSEEDHAVIESAIGYKKTLRYTVKAYQAGQKLPKNAIPLMHYSDELRQEAGKAYQNQKYWKLVKQIPEASVKLPIAIIGGIFSAVARDPYANIPFILAACFGIAGAIHGHQAQKQEEPLYPIGPATAHPAYFETLNRKHVAEKHRMAPLQPFEKLAIHALPDDDLLIDVVRNALREAKPLQLFLAYLESDRDEEAHILLHKEKALDLDHAGPHRTSILSFVVKLNTIDIDTKLKLSEKLIRMGAQIQIEDRASNPMFVAASVNDLVLVKFYLQKGSKTTIENGNLLAESLISGANEVCDYLMRSRLVEIDKKIKFKQAASLLEKGHQIPILAALMQNKISTIESWINRQQLSLKTLEFYFEDLFVAAIVSDNEQNFIQLFWLLYDGTENIFQKWDILVQKFSSKINMNNALQRMKVLRQTDVEMRECFQQNDVEKMITSLTKLLSEKRFIHVKNLLRTENIDINDPIGKQPLITHIVDSKTITSTKKIEICAKLMDWKADINSDHISNPMMHAIQQDDLSLVLFFEGKGGKYVLPNHHALYWAIQSNANAVMNHLLKNVFDINEIIEEGPIAAKPVLAIANSKNRHILKKLRSMYALNTDILFYYFDEIIDIALDFKDSDSWLLNFVKTLELDSENNKRILVDLLVHRLLIPHLPLEKALEFKNFINTNYPSLKITSVTSNPLGKNTARQPGTLRAQEIREQYGDFWGNLAHRYSDFLIYLYEKNPYLYISWHFVSPAITIAGIWTLFLLLRSEKSNNSQTKMILKEVPVLNEGLLKLIADQNELSKGILKLKITLTKKEKKIYQQISITDETEQFISQILSESGKKLSENEEVESQFLRWIIIRNSPEYAKKMVAIFSDIVDMNKVNLNDIPFPLYEQQLKENPQLITITLTNEEKALYKDITITDGTRNKITEQLCEFLSNPPKNAEEQGKILRKQIIENSSEYINVTANNLFISKIASYQDLVNAHQKLNFEEAFIDIRNKNSTPPVLSRQLNILDKLQQHGQRVETHQKILDQIESDLQNQKKIIEHNKEKKHDHSDMMSMLERFNAIINERETIKQWCNTQGVKVNVVEKIKTRTLEPAIKPTIKKTRSSIPQIETEAPITNIVPAATPVPQISKILPLPKELDYTKKTIAVSREFKKVPVVKDKRVLYIDKRVLYIVHLMQLMGKGNVLEETDPDLQRDAAHQLLSKCSDFIYTFFHLHREIQEQFPLWKNMWVLRNRVLHNIVLWNQQTPKELINEFLGTFKEPFYAFKDQGFFNEPIETNKLKNLYLFMSTTKTESMPNYDVTIQKLERLCLNMHRYSVMADDANVKQLFACDGALHAAMSSTVLQMRDLHRELQTLKKDPIFSGPQYVAQRRRCNDLLAIINTIKMKDGKTIIGLADTIAHETNDFKNREVSTDFYNGYQFRLENENQVYYVQEPVPYLTLLDLFQELSKHKILSWILETMGSKETLNVKIALPEDDAKLTFAPDR